MKRQSQHTRRKADTRHASTRAKSRVVQPRTVANFVALSVKDQDFWRDVGHVVTDVRAGASLRQASAKYRRDPRKVRQAAPSAFRKLKNGRYAAKSIDRLLRVLLIPTRKGLRETGVRDSRQASLLGTYWTAVERYRDTGDASALREFRGQHIVDASGKRTRLLTNLHELDRLGSAGVLSFETLYARAA